jgi:hypothetical protein
VQRVLVGRELRDVRRVVGADRHGPGHDHIHGRRRRHGRRANAGRDAAVTLGSQDTVTAPQCIGPLSNTAPAIASFTARLTGLDQTVHTTLGAWSVTDARGTDAGYSVSVSASAPTVNGSLTAAGTGASITLTPGTATRATGNPATSGPVKRAAQVLSTTPVTIDNAPAGTGQGEWDFAADPGGNPSLAIVIPGNASAGTYSSTLTFTTAPPAT